MTIYALTLHQVQWTWNWFLLLLLVFLLLCASFYTARSSGYCMYKHERTVLWIFLLFLVCLDHDRIISSVRVCIAQYLRECVLMLCVCFFCWPFVYFRYLSQIVVCLFLRSNTYATVIGIATQIVEKKNSCCYSCQKMCVCCWKILTHICFVWHTFYYFSLLQTVVLLLFCFTWI